MWRARTIFSVVALLLAACSPSSVQTSDARAFWTFFADPTLSEVEHYEDVSSMARSAELVLVGVPTKVAAGRTWGPIGEPGGQVGSVMIEVAVIEVISGRLPTATDLVSLEVSLPGYSAANVSDLVGSGSAVLNLRNGSQIPLPNTPALFFLRWRNDDGSESLPGQVEPVGGKSYRLVSSQGLIIDVDGKAVAPLLLDLGGDTQSALQRSIKGLDFDDTVERTREAVP